METDREYYERRADEEREAAGRATNSWARSVHVEMADRFSDRAKGLSGHGPASGRATAAG